MNLAPRIFVFFLSMLCALASCSSDGPLAGSASERSFNRGTAVASVPGLAKQLGAPFLRHAEPDPKDQLNAPGDVKKEPFFSTPWSASFERASDGTLTAVTQDESPAAVDGVQPTIPVGKDRIATRFPATASGDLEVTAGEKPGVWIREHLIGATENAHAQVSDGRVVYTGAKPGVDRVYEVSGQRVEEYLRLADANALQGVQYEVETGPGIADLVVDGSGYGLEARDANGVQVLKAPQPTGVDAQGNGVQGKLAVSRTSPGHYAVRVELAEEKSVQYPVLLDPSWVSAGSMASARVDHTSTLLGNGKVLVAGGSNGIYFASAELYDPATNTWSAAATFATARSYHTATLLGNGNVLVAGGVGNSGSLASAELYDPATNTWSSATLATARRYHTATLLGNGKVLVAGGYGSQYLASAELYDPATNTWSAAATLVTARERHTATMLSNGEVLVAGGIGAGYPQSAELYDPATNTWSAAGTLATGRYLHTATMLGNGKVLVAGGFGAGNLASAELYDPATNTWSTAATLATARQSPTATMLGNGKVLVAGGHNNIASAELYEPATNTWSAAGALATGRYRHTATMLGNGKVLLAAGYNSGNHLASAELYVLALANGTPCGVAAECASGICADGVCCDVSCGVCGACSVAAGAISDGICAAFPDGHPPESTCGGYLCDGVAPNCATICIGDDDCELAFHCDGSGACVPNLTHASSCNAVVGVGCKVAGCRVCGNETCADGVCCSTACSAGSCDRCDLPGSIGSCTIAPQGNTGSEPACGTGFVCDGTLSSCNSCTSDVGCAPNYYCAADGSCQPQKAQGDPCNPLAGQDCLDDNCRECVTGQCVDGSCCNSTCDGPCNACSFALGATADGICSIVADGNVGTPLCAPYVCNGASPLCPTACVNNGDCAGTAYCQNGTCHGAGQPGDSCTNAGECASNACADGVCCNTACTGPCEACNEPGHEGTCIPVQDQPRPPRLACAGDNNECQGYCNGQVTTTCTFPAQGTSCLEASCTGDVLTPAGLCDGAGVCQAQTTENCAPYTCDTTTKACRDGCVTNADCAGGNVCNADGKCAVSGATCQDATTAKSPDGTLTSCDPYRCLNGQCKSTCSTTADCAPGATCESGQCTTGTAGAGGTAGTAGSSGTSGTGGTAGSSSPAAAPASGDRGGCSVPSGSRGSSGGMLVIAAIAAAAMRRRRAG